MTVLLSLLALLVLCAACVGYGSFLMTVSGVQQYLTGNSDRIAFCFIVGLGIIGWLAFFPGVAGYLRTEMFWGLAVLGVVLLVRERNWFIVRIGIRESSTTDRILLAVLSIVLALDLIEGISPAADADSLAYHYALPKMFLSAGQIEFVPRAVSGAIPLLIQMTYAAAIGMGGELTLTLWTTITGWLPALLMYGLVRRSVSRSWALSIAILILTTPAVLYGGGNGQIEIRCAGFALACSALIVVADRERSMRVLAVAGILAGFFVGAKYFGLIFAGSVGLLLLCDKRGFQRAFVFGGAILIAGFQWYLWNWMHTGDPVFPALTNLLQFPDRDIWTREFGLYFAEILALGELPLERSIANWIAYPVLATFNLTPEIEGGRTGLGMFVLVALPFALLGAIGNAPGRREATLLLLIAGIFFTVWFFSGTTQRVRHLLPIYPIVLLAMFPIAVHAARRMSIAVPLVAGVAITITLQLGGQMLFSVNYLAHIFGGETRAEFLQRNVPGSNTVPWINDRLPPDARVGFMNRQLAYLIDRPSYMMHPHIQALIDTRPIAGDEARFVAQVQKKNLNYFLIPGDWHGSDSKVNKSSAFLKMIGRLVSKGCLRPVKSFKTVGISSRTLGRFGSRQFTSDETLLTLVPEQCPAPRH